MRADEGLVAYLDLMTLVGLGMSKSPFKRRMFVLGSCPRRPYVNRTARLERVLAAMISRQARGLQALERACGNQKIPSQEYL